MKSKYLNILLLALLIIVSQSKKIDEEQKQQHYNQIHTFKLEGNTTFAYFYTSVYVGTPPQRQTVIVDTGSYLLGFPCTDCKGKSCGKHIDKPFDQSKSLTTADVTCNESVYNFKCNNCDQTTKQCKWSISYAEGSSLSGHVMQDYVLVGDEVNEYIKNDYEYLDIEFVKFLRRERVYMPVGCTTRETNLFLTQDADGILGLSSLTNSGGKWPNVVDVLFENHKNNDESLVFSLCLSNVDGGYMTIGGYNHRLHKQGAPTHVIPYVGNGMYTINLHSLAVNGVDLKIDQSSLRNVIVDSGTTLLFGPSKVIKAIMDQIFSYCDDKKNRCLGKQEKQKSQTCWRRNVAEQPNLQHFFDSFPVIEFELDSDFVFKWKAENYFFVDPMRGSDENLWCPAFETSGSRVLLGGAWMRQYDILFDREKTELHFTESDCNSKQIDNHYIEHHQNEIETTQEDYDLYEEILDKLGPEYKMRERQQKPYDEDEEDNGNLNRDLNNIDNKNNKNQQQLQLVLLIGTIGAAVVMALLGYVGVRKISKCLRRRRRRLLRKSKKNSNDNKISEDDEENNSYDSDDEENHDHSQHNINLDKSVHPAARQGHDSIDQSSFDKSHRHMEIGDQDEDLSKEVDQDYSHNDIEHNEDEI